MLRTGQLLHPASTPTSQPTPGASLPGTLASPRTGLSPAGCRELVARLRHDCSFAFRRPSCWTHRIQAQWISFAGRTTVHIVTSTGSEPDPSGR